MGKCSVNPRVNKDVMVMMMMMMIESYKPSKRQSAKQRGPWKKPVNVDEARYQDRLTSLWYTLHIEGVNCVQPLRLNNTIIMVRELLSFYNKHR